MQVMLRVGDLDKSIQYYTEALGMKVIRRKDVESQKYTLAFLGYGDEDNNVAIELTCAHAEQHLTTGVRNPNRVRAGYTRCAACNGWRSNDSWRA